MTAERQVHVTNFGYVYCTSHGVDRPGVLSERCGAPHVVQATIDEGSCGTNSQCSWPACGMVFNPAPPPEAACPDCHSVERVRVLPNGAWSWLFRCDHCAVEYGSPWVHSRAAAHAALHAARKATS